MNTNMETNQIKSYKDLKIWQESHQIAMEVFRLFNQVKKTSASYDLWQQVIRSVFSVPGNIVEGFYSHRGANYVSKLSVARGEAGETDYWLFVLSEIKDITNEKYEGLSSRITDVIRMITGLQKKII